MVKLAQEKKVKSSWKFGGIIKVKYRYMKTKQYTYSWKIVYENSSPEARLKTKIETQKRIHATDFFHNSNLK